MARRGGRSSSRGSGRSRIAARRAARSARNSSSRARVSASSSKLRSAIASRKAVRLARRPTTTRANSSLRNTINARGAIRLARNNPTIENLNRANALAGVAIASNPALQNSYNSYLTETQRINSLAPDQRDQFFSDLESQAQAAIDIPFAADEKRIKESLQFAIDKLNATYNQFSDVEMTRLKNAITNIDKETAQDITQNLDDLNRRGALNSGILMNVADTIVGEQVYNRGVEQKSTDLALKGAQLTRDYGIKGAQLEADAQLADLSEQEIAARESELDRIYSGMSDINTGFEALSKSSLAYQQAQAQRYAQQEASRARVSNLYSRDLGMVPSYTPRSSYYAKPFQARSTSPSVRIPTTTSTKLNTTLSPRTTRYNNAVSTYKRGSTTYKGPSKTSRTRR